VHHHKRRPVKPRPPYISIIDRARRLAPLFLAIVCLLVAGIGVKALAKGNLVYYNYKGLAVYAPFAIVIVLAAFLIVLLRWKKFRVSK
jgi:hypothetical protein